MSDTTPPQTVEVDPHALWDLIVPLYDSAMVPLLIFPQKRDANRRRDLRERRKKIKAMLGLSDQ